MEHAPYQMPDGTAVDEALLSGPAGPLGMLQARIIAHGARLVSLTLPDPGLNAPREARRDLVLGLDSIADYLASPFYHGATVGRIANRIAKGRLPLGGRDYRLEPNEGENHLHGGPEGLDRRLWRITDRSGDSLRLEIHSEDGDMGYPGRLWASVTYRLHADGLEIVMEAQSDKVTAVNLAHHSYWNLAGAGTVEAHRLQVNAGAYTPVGPEKLVTGEIRGVAGTVFDLRQGAEIAALTRALAAAGESPDGLDHNFCIASQPGANGLREAARLAAPAAGLELLLFTDQPGLQVYAGGGLFGSGKGRDHPSFAGIALESQKYPGGTAIPGFPDLLLHPGQTYRHRMRFRLRRI